MRRRAAGDILIRARHGAGAQAAAVVAGPILHHIGHLSCESTSSREIESRGALRSRQAQGKERAWSRERQDTRSRRIEASSIWWSV